MDALMANLRASPALAQSRHFAVVALCEDAVTDNRAAEICHEVSNHLASHTSVSGQTWLLSELRSHSLRSAAVADLASANLVIVSLHHGSDLPAEVSTLLDLWIAHPRRRPEAALVALFDSFASGISTPMQAALRQLARRGGIPFFARYEDTPEDDLV
jgi:hypothetical protein